MTKTFIKHWIITFFIWLILLILTPSRINSYFSNLSLIGLNILISIFPALVFSWVTTFILQKFVFKNTEEKISFSNKLVYKRLLANLVDFAIMYVLLALLLVPFGALYTYKVVNAVVFFMLVIVILTIFPILFFYYQWRKGGTIGYKLLKIKLNIEKSNLLLRAILKVLLSGFTVFGFIGIYISLIASKGKKDLLDLLVKSEAREG